MKYIFSLKKITFEWFDFQRWSFQEIAILEVAPVLFLGNRITRPELAPPFPDRLFGFANKLKTHLVKEILCLSNP